MSKIIYFLMCISIFVPSYSSQKPTLAKLNNVYSNNMQEFGISQYKFICRAYGVISVDELYLQAKEGSVCKNAIDHFYAQNPLLKYYSASLLKINQYYQVSFKNNRCIIYAKGMNTLSELLLKNGLALKKTNFQDEEFEASFFKAQREAQENNKGMYKNKIKKRCIAETFAIEQKDSK